MSEELTSPEHKLHDEFCKFGSHYLQVCRTTGLELDPKIYETIYKYLDGRELEGMPSPDEGSLAEKQIAALKGKDK